MALCCCCFFACSKGGGAAPVIDESKLPSLLADIHIAEVAIQDASTTTKDSIAELWYGVIFKEHGVDRKAFDETMRELRKDPKRVVKLYEKVQEELDKRK